MCQVRKLTCVHTVQREMQYWAAIKTCANGGTVLQNTHPLASFDALGNCLHGTKSQPFGQYVLLTWTFLPVVLRWWHACSCSVAFRFIAKKTARCDGHESNLWCLQDTTPVEVVADNLDLSPYCSMAARKQARKPVYNLTAVTNHSGSMSGGHYTAQCRSALDSSWYDCNDSSVRPDKFVEGPSGSAYVLFYRLQD